MVTKSEFEYDVFVVSAVVDMHAKCGDLDLACEILKEITAEMLYHGK